MPRRVWMDVLCALTDRAHCRGMMHFSEPILIPSTSDEQAGHVGLAAAAYLGRFKGSSREHTESGLRCYLTWCVGRSLDPLAARRPDLELTVFRKTRGAETAEVARAMHAQSICEAGHSRGHEVFDREVN